MLKIIEVPESYNSGYEYSLAAVTTDDIFAVIQEELDEETEVFPVIHGIANWMYANAA